MKAQLQLALRVLARRKFFTFISLFGISFTLVVLMLVTAIVDHVFAAHPPETRLDRTLGVYRMELIGKDWRRRSGPNWSFLDEQIRTLPGVERVSIFRVQHGVIAYHQGRKLKLYIKRTDGEFWKILDFRFVEGAPYTSADHDAGRFVAVINESTRERFFGDEPALGRSITLDGQTFRVAGVVEDVPITRVVPFGDVWTPITTAKSQAYRFEPHTDDFMALVLANSAADFPRLKAEVQRRTNLTPVAGSDQFERRNTALETPFEALASQLPSGELGERLGIAPPLLLRGMLGLMAILFMVLPAMNLVNLNLSRILERASEVGVRKAYGASNRQLVAQFVMENVVLTLIGAVIGLGLSAAVLHLINASGAIPYADFGVNWRIFGWGVLFAIVFGVVSGVFPAWRIARLHPVLALKGGAR
ncbi:MAG: ABC transporter permease [Thermoanaerobaculia bacterium]